MREIFGPDIRPRNIKETRIKEIFEKHGEVSDLTFVLTPQVSQVKYFPKRHFAYIGYIRDKDASNALKYMNETFIDTSKIEVLIWHVLLSTGLCRSSIW